MNKNDFKWIQNEAATNSTRARKYYATLVCKLIDRADKANTNRKIVNEWKIKKNSVSEGWKNKEICNIVHVYSIRLRNITRFHRIS